MAIEDSATGEVIIRVVYDGPPLAGKTTSLRALSEMLARTRRSDVFTPDEASGRTLYFDWLDYLGGWLDGKQVRCQIVSLPGQRALASRRALLLRDADVVIIVLDSTQQGIEAARTCHDALRAHGPGPDDLYVPIVFQANKQDLPQALSVDLIRDELRGLGMFSVVPSNASDGTGIRESFTFAVRLALDRVRELKRQGRLARETPSIATGEDLLDWLEAEESRQPEASVELRLEPGASSPSVADAHASARSPLWGGPATDGSLDALDSLDSRTPSALDAGRGPDDTREPRSGAASAVEDASLEEADIVEVVPLGAAADEVAASTRPAAVRASTPVVDAPVRTPEKADGAGALGPTPSPAGGSESEHAPLVAPAREAPRAIHGAPARVPASPKADVPSGLVWPPMVGRIVLQELETASVSITATRDGGFCGTRSERWILASDRDQSYPELEQGRTALLASARRHTRLSEWLTEHRAVVLAETGDGTWRLWRVARTDGTLRQRLLTCLAEPSGRELLDIASALVDAERRLREAPAALPLSLGTIVAHRGRIAFAGLVPDEGSEAGEALEPATLIYREMGLHLEQLAQTANHRLPVLLKELREAAIGDSKRGQLADTLALALIGQ